MVGKIQIIEFSGFNLSTQKFLSMFISLKKTLLAGEVQKSFMTGDEVKPRMEFLVFFNSGHQLGNFLICHKIGVGNKKISIEMGQKRLGVGVLQNELEIFLENDLVLILLKGLEKEVRDSA